MLRCRSTRYLHRSWSVRYTLLRACGMLTRLLAGMYALRERRQHVTQEDFEFAIAKVRAKSKLWKHRSLKMISTGLEEEPGRKYIGQQALLMMSSHYMVIYRCSCMSHSPSNRPPSQPEAFSRPV